MSKALIAATILSAVFVTVMFAYVDPFTAITSEYKQSPEKQLMPGLFLNSTKIEKSIHEMINEHREAKGLRPLQWDDRLAAIARTHSEDMANKGYFDHSDLDGHDHEYRYEIHNYQCQYASGENIFMTQKPPVGDSDKKIADLAAVGWMNSKGHRENILYDGFHNEGIGVFVRATDVHITQNFC